MNRAIPVLAELMKNNNSVALYRYWKLVGPNNQELYEYDCEAFGEKLTVAENSKYFAKRKVAHLMLKALADRGHCVPHPYCRRAIATSSSTHYRSVIASRSSSQTTYTCDSTIVTIDSNDGSSNDNVTEDECCSEPQAEQEAVPSILNTPAASAPPYESAKASGSQCAPSSNEEIKDEAIKEQQEEQEAPKPLPNTPAASGHASAQSCLDSDTADIEHEAIKEQQAQSASMAADPPGVQPRHSKDSDRDARKKLATKLAREVEESWARGIQKLSIRLKNNRSLRRANRVARNVVNTWSQRVRRISTLEARKILARKLSSPEKVDKWTRDLEETLPLDLRNNFARDLREKSIIHLINNIVRDLRKDLKKHKQTNKAARQSGDSTQTSESTSRRHADHFKRVTALVERAERPSST